MPLTRHSYFFLLLFCGALIALAASLHAEAPLTSAETPSRFTSPWTKPRELSEFQKILKHSPFSLATAEETSLLSERYMITGVITIDGENEVFVFDRNDQSHELLTKTPNSKSMSLVDVLHQEDPSLLKATITANGETGVISNIDTSTTAQAGQRPGGAVPGSMSRAPNQQRNVPYVPGVPHYPGSQYPNQPNQPMNSLNPNRRIIRRPAITPQPSNQGYQQPSNQNYQNR